MSLHIITLPSCASTSAVLADMPDAPAGTVVSAVAQTAGRGQRGNFWEAEPGKNLTFSQLLRPDWPAARQFELSMVIAIAIAEGIDKALGAKRTTIKWPNDIYVDDKKICGILIENKLGGANIERLIAGIGINVNQRQFRSDAPNPVSIWHYTGEEQPLEPLLQDICNHISESCEAYIAAPDPEMLSARYHERLYRFDGHEHAFREPGGEPFEAKIESVALDGMFSLSNGKSYAFKEIAYVI